MLAGTPWQAERLDFLKRGLDWQARRAIQRMLIKVYSLTGANRLAERVISPFAAPLISAAKRIPADLYIAHYPAALPPAAIAAQKYKARYAYDAEDFHLGDWPEGPEHGDERSLLRAVEGRYLPECAYVTAASPGIADAYVEAYGITRPTVVLNVFPRAEAPDAPTAAGTARPGPSIYWFSQTIGPNRGLEAAVKAIGHARTMPHLYLRGHPAEGMIDRLRALAAQTNASDRLHFLPSASPMEMVRLANPYDLSLSSETSYSVNRRIALNNKIFTYILAGVPVLLSDIPAHRDLAKKVGLAAALYAADDPFTLASLIDRLLSDPNGLADARAAAFQLGQTIFNWDVEKSVLIERIASVTSGRITLTSQANPADHGNEQSVICRPNEASL